MAPDLRTDMHLSAPPMSPERGLLERVSDRFFRLEATRPSRETPDPELSSPIRCKRDRLLGGFDAAFRIPPEGVGVARRLVYFARGLLETPPPREMRNVPEDRF